MVVLPIHRSLLFSTGYGVKSGYSSVPVLISREENALFTPWLIENSGDLSVYENMVETGNKT